VRPRLLGLLAFYPVLAAFAFEYGGMASQSRAGRKLPAPLLVGSIVGLVVFIVTYLLLRAHPLIESGARAAVAYGAGLVVALLVALLILRKRAPG